MIKKISLIAITLLVSSCEKNEHSLENNLDTDLKKEISNAAKLSRNLGVWDVLLEGYSSSDDSKGKTINSYINSDFDGDGKLDIVTADNEKGVLYFDYSGNNFGKWDRTAVGYGKDGLHFSGDYNGDGKSDIFFVNKSGTIYIDYSANGWDKILNGYSKSDSSNRYINSDFDGDGKFDIAVSDDKNGVLYFDYSKNGYGKWDRVVNGYGKGGLHFSGDYNGDGKSDIFYVNQAGTIYIDYSVNGWDKTLPGYSLPYSSDNGYINSDFDGDGKLDIVVADNEKGIIYFDYSNNGFGVWDEIVSGYGKRGKFIWESYSTHYSGDFDGDNKSDIMMVNKNGSIYLNLSSL